MRERRQWLLASPDAKGDLKVPTSLNAEGQTFLSNTTRSNWLESAEVFKAAVERELGCGYCIAADDPYACIDLDVKDHTTPEQLDRYRKIVDAFGSYTEFSQSGKGLHIWVRGKVDGGRKRDGVEIYSDTRFIGCTGNVVLDRPIVEGQQLLSILHAELGRGDKPQVELEDIECDETAESVASNALDPDGNPRDNELGRLFAGNWQGRQYPSQSEADVTLVMMFQRFTKSDRTAWNAFMMSKLADRDKAERPDYRRRTLAAARTMLADDELKIAHGKSVAQAIFWPPVVQTLAAAAPAPALPIAQWGAAFSPHYKLLHDDDLRAMKPEPWFVKTIIPATGVGSIYGPSGTYKSFLTLDLLAHISNGWDWFGCRTTARPVVYVPFEGKGGVPKRVQAWRADHADKPSKIAFLFAGLNLRNAADRAKLVRTLLEQGWAGGVLCIDTLAQAGPGIDENSSEGMGEMIGIFQELQTKLGGVVLVVHHTGKDVTQGLRGWSGLLGALDFTIECQAMGKLTGKFVVKKVKDEDAGRAYDFDLTRVELYVDDDGDTVTSLSVAPKVKFTGLGLQKAVVVQDAAADEFVWHWFKAEFDKGNHPSANSVDGQREQMKPQRAMTQAELRNAIARLKAEKRLVSIPASESATKNAWLRAIDRPQ